MAYYRAKKKSLGSKIMVWVCLLAMILSTSFSLLYYLFK